jgi:hypothetical protein
MTGRLRLADVTKYRIEYHSSPALTGDGRPNDHVNKASIPENAAVSQHAMVIDEFHHMHGFDVTL